MTEKGRKQLEDLLMGYDDVMKTKFLGGKPADIEPLKFNLRPTAVSVRLKHSRYPFPKREFMTRYVKQLLKLGFVWKVTSPE